MLAAESVVHVCLDGGANQPGTLLRRRAGVETVAGERKKMEVVEPN